MKTLQESIIGKRGAAQDTNIISQCREMIALIETSPWRDAMVLANDFYDQMLYNLDKYPSEVRRIINDSIALWDGKVISASKRTDIFIQAIRSISNLAKKQRS